MIYISKQANLEGAFKQFVTTVWDFNRGPAENIFRALPFAAIPFFGGFGKIVGFIILNFAGQILGISAGDIGKAIDQHFGWGPGDDPRDNGSVEQIELFINNMFQEAFAKKAMVNNSYPMSKNASIWSAFLKSGKIGRVLTKAIYRFITMMGSVFVFSHLGKFTEELAEGPKKQIKEWTKTKEVPNSLEKAKDRLGLEPLPESKQPSGSNSVNKMISDLEEKYGLK